ncbi:MAG: hypothetical protein MZV63_32490 [Marinilabiliales bacterium]|nr:hypothetical protein [Marinilabiliales bacterium]
MTWAEDLTVLETVPAGVMPSMKVTSGTCSRIMTGAAIPEGADYVFMLEEAEEPDRRQGQVHRKSGQGEHSQEGGGSVPGTDRAEAGAFHQASAYCRHGICQAPPK